LNLKNLHTEEKAVQTNVLFEPTQNVISIQIAKGEQLREHITKIPALLVCVSGSATFSDENEQKISLKSGDYVKIEPNVKHRVDAIEMSNFLLIK
jgi:quercetin dioxygenase-like cupin family protein